MGKYWSMVLSDTHTFPELASRPGVAKPVSQHRDREEAEDGRRVSHPGPGW